jgi:DNA-binding IclR family transcriptional regulator
MTADKLLTYLGRCTKPATAAEIMADCDLSRRAMYTALVELEGIGAVRLSPDCGADLHETRAWEVVPQPVTLSVEVA